jgi:hypothetical protein
MAPKTADGYWKYDPEEFDPIWAGGQGGRDYYSEMNAWRCTWRVPTPRGEERRRRRRRPCHPIDQPARIE